MEMNSQGTDGVRRLLIAICQMALRGALSLDDLQRLWPAETADDSFFRQVYDDVEDGVEHLPGFAFRAGVNQEEWERSEMYWRIYLDIVLLEQPHSTDRLQRCRETIAVHQSRDHRMVRSLVDACLRETSNDESHH